MSGPRAVSHLCTLLGATAWLLASGCGSDEGSAKSKDEQTMAEWIGANAPAPPPAETPAGDPGPAGDPSPGAPVGDPPPATEDPLPADPAPGTPDPPSDPGPAPGPVNCDATAQGMLWEAGDPINYHGQTVSTSATHVAGEGCLTTIHLTFTIGGKCPLNLSFTGEGGSWSLLSASLKSDPECGPGWGSGKIYSAGVGSSSATLSGVPSMVSQPASGETCTALGAKLDVGGTLHLTSGSSSVDVALTMLRVSGALKSVGGGGSCGAAPPPCVGVGCGYDALGNYCGGCGSGQVCQSGQCVAEAPPPDDPPPADPDPPPLASCPAGGTGQGVGSQIKNIAWTDENGQQVSLHDWCGNVKAILLLKTAAW